MNKVYNINKIFLKKEYIKKQKSQIQIAKEIGCSRGLLYLLFKKYKIKCRPLSETNKGIKNGMFGKHHTTTSKDKMRKKLRGINAPNYIDGRSSKIYYCIDCNKKISNYQHVRCPNCACKGRRNGMFGQISPHGKKILYNNIWMRSTWEYKYAQFLDLNSIKWLYESKRFYFKETSYLPDFYIPEWDLYIEIKGYWRDKSRKRFNLFKKYYPKENIKLLMQKDLQEMGIIQ